MEITISKGRGLGLVQSKAQASSKAVANLNGCDSADLGPKRATLKQYRPTVEGNDTTNPLNRLLRIWCHLLQPECYTHQLTRMYKESNPSCEITWIQHPFHLHAQAMRGARHIHSKTKLVSRVKLYLILAKGWADGSTQSHSGPQGRAAGKNLLFEQVASRKPKVSWQSCDALGLMILESSTNSISFTVISVFNVAMSPPSSNGWMNRWRGEWKMAAWLDKNRKNIKAWMEHDWMTEWVNYWMTELQRTEWMNELIN